MNACLLAAYFGENETLQVCRSGTLAVAFDSVCTLLKGIAGVVCVDGCRRKGGPDFKVSQDGEILCACKKALA